MLVFVKGLGWAGFLGVLFFFLLNDSTLREKVWVPFLKNRKQKIKKKSSLLYRQAFTKPHARRRTLYRRRLCRFGCEVDT